MSKEELRTSYEWATDGRYAELTIMDPDGWNRGEDDYQFSFYEEKITKDEFERRIMNSTIEWNRPLV